MLIIESIPKIYDLPALKTGSSILPCVSCGCWVLGIELQALPYRACDFHGANIPHITSLMFLLICH